MTRPLIGLTIGPDAPQPSGYLRLRATYPDAIAGAGGLPVLIPPLADPDALRELLGRLDGVLFPGGLDVDPSHFGEVPHPKTDAHPALDRLEIAVAGWAAETHVPALGICRGQQLLNVALGGALIQDLPSAGQNGHAQAAPRAQPTHTLEVAAGSRLADIFGATAFEVNSFHHQAVGRLGDGLRAVAWSPDGVVEAIESQAHPWLLAVQFHPEDLVGFHAPSQALFGAFVEACRQRMTRL